jgi:hypothetical protein
MERGKTGMSYQDFLRERRFSLDVEGECSQNYFKYLITLASGALGLSVAFIEKIAPHPVHINIIIAAWALFAASLAAVMLAFLLSWAGCKVEQEIIRRIYYSEGKDQNLPRNRAAAASSIFVQISAALFLLGVAALVSFSSLNLIHRSNALDRHPLPTPEVARQEHRNKSAVK